jgi:hypothetical protein
MALVEQWRALHHDELLAYWMPTARPACSLSRYSSRLDYRHHKARCIPVDPILLEYAWVAAALLARRWQ